MFNGLMRRVAGQIAYRAVRNHGTIGGSVALADPAADWPCCLLALGASVRVVGRNGVRMQRVDDFIQAPTRPAWPPAKSSWASRSRRRAPFRWGFAKVARKSGAFAHSLAVARRKARTARSRWCSAPPARARIADRDGGTTGGSDSRRNMRAAIAADLDAHSANSTPIRSGCTRRMSCAPEGHASAMTAITIELNGVNVVHEVEPRQSLADFLRDRCGLTATHLGCEHGACGACTVVVDGIATRSCLIARRDATAARCRRWKDCATSRDGVAAPAFHESHALQCGFCTPGMLIMARDILRGTCPDADTVRHELSGQICRCTGYANIVKAIVAAGQEINPGTEVHLLTEHADTTIQTVTAELPLR